MNQPQNNAPIEGELEPKATDAGTLNAVVRAEIDGQIATARAFPRSVSAFIKEARQLVSMDEEVAEACIYSLPRGKDRNGQVKFITGPSARFAEIIQHTFGNNRAGGRVVSIDKTTITAQGVYHDLEKNVQITKEVSRNILDRSGKRYNNDMIGVTGNAAISIALRNATLAGIPQALWMPIYEAARMAAVGDITTLAARRANAIAWFGKLEISPEAIFAKLEVDGIEDIGIEHLETLVGIKTALRRGDYTPEQAFRPEPEAAQSVTGLADKIQKATQQEATPSGQVERKAADKPPKKDGPVPASVTDALVDGDSLRRRLVDAPDIDALDDAATLLTEIQDADLRTELKALYDKRRLAFDAAELP